jgi:hypothetical protein
MVGFEWGRSQSSQMREVVIVVDQFELALPFSSRSLV